MTYEVIILGHLHMPLYFIGTFTEYSDLFVSLLETEIKYPILQRGILPFWTPSLVLNAPLEALFLFL